VGRRGERKNNKKALSVGISGTRSVPGTTNRHDEL